MEELSFIGFNDLGHLSCNVVDAELSLLFLKEEDHVLLELSILDQNDLKVLHEGDLSDSWFKGLTALRIIEASNRAEIAVIDISLSQGGRVYYEMGDLYIDIPDQEFLIAQTIKMLEVYGYYCGNSIIKFCLEHRGRHCIDPLIGYYDDEYDINEKFDLILRGE